MFTGVVAAIFTIVTGFGLGPAVVEAPPGVDPFAPITSPDVGDQCAPGLDADEINEFFSNSIGGFQGADYQRATRLPDGRVLWTFQDAFVSGTLVHNVGMIQSGRCFTMLNSGARSWLLGDRTAHMSQWHWILDAAPSSDGTEIHLFVVQMNETGGAYLSGSRPTAMRRVVLDSTSLEQIDVIDESATGEDLRLERHLRRRVHVSVLALLPTVRIRGHARLRRARRGGQAGSGPGG